MLSAVNVCQLAGGRSIGATSEYFSTSCQHMRWVNSEYLDRQTVRCPQGMVLSWFKYTSRGCWWHEGRYEFECRHAETAEEKHRDSKCELLRGENLEFLDRQRPKCEANEVMTGFQLFSDGCNQNEMRYRTWCSKLQQPWWEWGRENEAIYQRKYMEHWRRYSRWLAKYNELSIPSSMSGQRIKDKYMHHYKMYEHYKNAYGAVANERQAIKFYRLWRRFRSYPTKSSEAQTYEESYKHFHNLYLRATGNPPEEPKATYPTGCILTPPKKLTYADVC